MKQEMKKTSKIALSAVFAALSVALMALVSIIPNLELALPAISGLFVAVIVIEVDKKWALGTRAAEFPDVVENAEKERRSREMIAAAGEVRHEFLERQIGRTVEVLFEEKLRDGSIQGYTANYTPVRIKSGCTHGLHKVKITACGDDWCEGELI